MLSSAHRSVILQVQDGTVFLPCVTLHTLFWICLRARISVLRCVGVVAAAVQEPKRVSKAYVFIYLYRGRTWFDILLCYIVIWFWSAATMPGKDFDAIKRAPVCHFAGTKCLGVTGPAIK